VKTRRAAVSKTSQQGRPRERLIERGAAALSAAELIAIRVRTGSCGVNAVDIGKQLVRKFGSLGAITKASVDEWQCIRGIGRDKAVALVTAFTLQARWPRNCSVNRKEPIWSSGSLPLKPA